MLLLRSLPECIFPLFSHRICFSVVIYSFNQPIEYVKKLLYFSTKSILWLCSLSKASVLVVLVCRLLTCEFRFSCSLLQVSSSCFIAINSSEALKRIFSFKSFYLELLPCLIFSRFIDKNSVLGIRREKLPYLWFMEKLK